MSLYERHLNSPETQMLMRSKIDGKSTLSSTRRVTRIPIDLNNSRLLRGAIESYNEEQDSDIHELLNELREQVNVFTGYIDSIPSTQRVHEEHLYAVGQHIRTIGAQILRVRPTLRQIEPRCYNTDTLSSFSSHRQTQNNRNSFLSDASANDDYRSASQTFLELITIYRKCLDTYYERLIAHTENFNRSFWESCTPDDAGMPLLTDTLTVPSAAILRRSIATCEQSISEGERKIKQWHKLLGRYSRHDTISEDDFVISNSSHRHSLDTEKALVSIKESSSSHNSLNSRKKKIQWFYCVLATLVVIFSTCAVIGAVAVLMIFYGNPTTDDLIQTSSDIEVQAVQPSLNLSLSTTTAALPISTSAYMDRTVHSRTKITANPTAMMTTLHRIIKSMTYHSSEATSDTGTDSTTGQPTTATRDSLLTTTDSLRAISTKMASKQANSWTVTMIAMTASKSTSLKPTIQLTRPTTVTNQIGDHARTSLKTSALPNNYHLVASTSSLVPHSEITTLNKTDSSTPGQSSTNLPTLDTVPGKVSQSTRDEIMTPIVQGQGDVSNTLQRMSTRSDVPSVQTNRMDSLIPCVTTPTIPSAIDQAVETKDFSTNATAGTNVSIDKSEATLLTTSSSASTAHSEDSTNETITETTISKSSDTTTASIGSSRGKLSVFPHITTTTRP